MRNSISIVFLTFVLTSSPIQAAGPSTSKPGFSKKSWGPPKEKSPDPTKTEPTNPTQNLKSPWDVSQVQIATRPKRGLQDLNIHLGASMGYILESDERIQPFHFGIRYIPHRNFEKSWDFGLEVHTKNMLNTAVGYRWYSPSEALSKGYYRLAVHNYINSNDGLAGIINLRHMKAIASVGSSDLFAMDRRLIAEGGVGYGIAGYIIYAQLGYNFNFF